MTEIPSPAPAAPLGSVRPVPSDAPATGSAMNGAPRDGFLIRTCSKLPSTPGVEFPDKTLFSPFGVTKSRKKESPSFIRAPAQEQLIIALGSQGLETLVMARVRYHVPAQAVSLFDPTNAVNERFLVECIFQRRLGS